MCFGKEPDNCRMAGKRARHKTAQGNINDLGWRPSNLAQTQSPDLREGQIYPMMAMRLISLKTMDENVPNFF